jgi:hypothetical protein
VIEWRYSEEIAVRKQKDTSNKYFAGRETMINPQRQIRINPKYHLMKLSRVGKICVYGGEIGSVWFFLPWLVLFGKHDKLY